MLCVNVFVIDVVVHACVGGGNVFNRTEVWGLKLPKMKYNKVTFSVFYNISANEMVL